MFEIAQVLGFFAMAFAIISFQMKTSGKILIVQSIASGLWIVHFTLLSAYTGAVLNIFSVARNFLYYFLQKKDVKGKVYFSTGAAVVGLCVSVFTYENLWSLLPMIATVIQCYSFSIVRAKYLRIATLFASPFWLTYDVYFRSYVGTATEVFAMISMIVALIRYRKED